MKKKSIAKDLIASLREAVEIQKKKLSGRVTVRSTSKVDKALKSLRKKNSGK